MSIQTLQNNKRLYKFKYDPTERKNIRTLMYKNNSGDLLFNGILPIELEVMILNINGYEYDWDTNKISNPFLARIMKQVYITKPNWNINEFIELTYSDKFHPKPIYEDKYIDIFGRHNMRSSTPKLINLRMLIHYNSLYRNHYGSSKSGFARKRIGGGYTKQDFKTVLVEENKCSTMWMKKNKQQLISLYLSY